MSRLTEHTRSGRWSRATQGPGPCTICRRARGRGPPTPPLDRRPHRSLRLLPGPPPYLPGEARRVWTGLKWNEFCSSDGSPGGFGCEGRPSWRSRSGRTKPALPGLGGSWSERNSCPGSHPLKKMPGFNRLFPLASLLLILWAGVCFPVCVEVPSETEAVQGNPMKLRCISCMKREDVEATTVVEWFYRPEGGKDFLIYEYRNGHQEVESPFQGRLQWNGSKDLQDVSITVLNVTLNDSGLYTCNVSREFEFEAHRPFVKTTRLIPLRVTEEERLGDDSAVILTRSLDSHP
ncbi:sodium channel regulatory subunit beta-3 isoform X2 [Physeter macrocephalus]|uniref:Sodium channel regulatory subunit beta-3 n=1 Tax=Physeter macrocephalus TaxID=9755 RepID=A0A455C759_PHYMC|nr:sodium channel subunit beta-3 isoform X2 [Physeter catodon]|eukprot:XP_028357175.1 sodium channel subunit beta-3 isoform X2 [Physeter catodon]